MARIPFTLEAWLKDKSQKIETRDGRIVHNIWPVKEQPIVNGKSAEVCALIDGEEDALVFFTGGKYLPVNVKSPFDLFIVMPEEELTEFEQEVSDIVEYCKEHGENVAFDYAKRHAKTLLTLAREQFKPEIDAEIEKAYNTQDDVVFHKGLEQGRADALKDLPRWRRWENGACGNSAGHPIALVSGAGGIRFVSVLGTIGEKYIMLDDLKKLAGFKEDEK